MLNRTHQAVQQRRSQKLLLLQFSAMTVMKNSDIYIYIYIYIYEWTSVLILWLGTFIYLSTLDIGFQSICVIYKNINYAFCFHSLVWLFAHRKLNEFQVGE